MSKSNKKKRVKKKYLNGPNSLRKFKKDKQEIILMGDQHFSYDKSCKVVDNKKYLSMYQLIKEEIKTNKVYVGLEYGLNIRKRIGKTDKLGYIALLRRNLAKIAKDKNLILTSIDFRDQLFDPKKIKTISFLLDSLQKIYIKCITEQQLKKYNGMIKDYIDFFESKKNFLKYYENNLKYIVNHTTKFFNIDKKQTNKLIKMVIKKLENIPAKYIKSLGRKMKEYIKKTETKKYEKMTHKEKIKLIHNFYDDEIFTTLFNLNIHILDFFVMLIILDKTHEKMIFYVGDTHAVAIGRYLEKFKYKKTFRSSDRKSRCLDITKLKLPLFKQN